MLIKPKESLTKWIKVNKRLMKPYKQVNKRLIKPQTSLTKPMKASW
jgi:hypothetical protein